MSFILDALRKSEAARRRSEAPDLFAAMPASAPTQAQRARWPLAIGAVGVLSLVAALWMFARDDRPSDEMAPQADTAGIDTPVAAPPAAPPATAARTPTLPRTATTLPPIPMPPTQAGPAKAGVAPAAAAPTTAMPATTPPPVLREQTVAAFPTAPVAPPPTAPPPATSFPAAPPSAPPRPPGTGSGDTIALAELDSGTRRQLPPLKLSMHLWNENPAQRLVILDGQRLREGDMIGEATVETITREGAVLNWQGYRLRIGIR